MLHRRRYLESPRSRHTRWSVAVVAVCALASAPPLWAQPAGDLRQFSIALESLSEQVRPAVVQIFATGFTPGEGVVTSTAALLSRQQGSGSGVILGADGYVITNAHVIENASRIRVELALVETDADGTRSVLRPRGEVVGAQVVGIDRETDLALLKLQLDRPLPVLELGDSEALRPGELVMAFGSPLGLATSVSMGGGQHGRSPAPRGRPDDLHPDGRHH